MNGMMGLSGARTRKADEYSTTSPAAGGVSRSYGIARSFRTARLEADPHTRVAAPDSARNVDLSTRLRGVAERRPPPDAYRWSIGTYFRSRLPTYWARGRINRLFAYWAST